MKKLALFLGSLLVVGTAVQAKEVVVAPTEVSKEIIVVAEPVVEEVVVVTPEFKPTGYVGVQYKAYGKTEGHGDKVRLNPEGNAQDDNQDTWNRGYNNYSRLETTFGIQATERFSLEGRIRDYNNLERNDESNVGQNGTETRLRAYYKHDDMFTSRVQYRDMQDDSQNLEYQLRINAYKNEGGLLSSAVVAPKVYHSFPKDGGGDYLNTLGVDVELLGNLPLGFTWENNYYFNQNFYGEKFYTNSDLTTKKDKKFEAIVELYLYNTVALWSNDTTTVDFNFEGGYDPYAFRQYNKYTEKDGIVSKSAKTTYELKAVLSLDAEYKLTETLAVNAGVGAEYRNWDNIDQSSASHWRWQPFAYAGMKATF